MKQVVRNFSKVTLEDPTGAKIYQVLNPATEQGVLTTSIPTSPLSREGYYGLKFEDDKGKIEYSSIWIERYELPRINWEVTCPSTISVLDRTAEISGSAQYIYGESTPGTVVVQCCRRTPKYGSEANCFRGVDDLCVEFTKELDENGKFNESLNMDMFRLPYSGLENYISCEMTLKEEGTGVQVPSSCNMWITNRLAVLSLNRFVIGRYYNKINMRFSATLTDEKSNPLAYKELTVQIDGIIVKYVTTDENGRAECIIDTSSYHNPNITLSAVYSDPDLCYGQDSSGRYYTYSFRDYPYDEVTLFRFHSQSGSQMRVIAPPGELPCYQDYSLEVEYSFTEDGVGKDATTTIGYIIVARNRIAAHGEISVDLSQSLKGSISIEVYADAKLATGAKVLVFAPMAKEIVSDIADLNIGVCFENKVNLTFTEQVVKPGTTVYRKISAEPGSFCGLRSRDAAFNLINSYDEFNARSVMNSVQTYLFGYQHGDVNYKDPEPPCIDGNKEHFCHGLYVKPSSSRTDGETYQFFEELSLLIFTKLTTRRPKVCGQEDEPNFPIIQPYFSGTSLERKTQTVRSNFADDFGFDSVTIGLNGESIIDSIIPDSITTWESDAFCMSDNKGIGLTIEPATVTTKQSFFVEASIPSYMIRGETVVVPVGVSNYMNKCAHISVQVESTDDYEMIPLEEMEDKCACSQEKSYWLTSVAFKTIGKVNFTITAETTRIADRCDGDNDDNEPTHSDTIIMAINVEAEGIRREASSSHLATVTDSTVEIDISVSEPVNLVPDSFTLTLKVMGDTVALSKENFNNLLSTPSGCCDQLQATLLSMIFLKNYLEIFENLSEEQSKKMKDALSSAMSPDLALVSLSALRTNFHLSKHIYVDDDIQIQTLAYLSRNQDLNTGCLNPEGRLLIYQENHNATIQVTAYASSILREVAEKYSNAGPLLEGIDRCLQNVDYRSHNTLTQSHLLNHAAALGNWDLWQSWYDILAEKAVDDGDILYWKDDNSVTLDRYRYFPGSDFGDVLITSNVLRSMTQHPTSNPGLNNKMASTAKYLSGQVTFRGGFYSPQATSTAIEALTRFGSKRTTAETNAQVSILQNGIEVFNVHINKENRFLMQSMELPSGFGEYKAIVSGTGSPFLQFSATYNTKIDKGENSSFSVIAQASQSGCSNGVAPKMSLQVSVSYNAKRSESSVTLVSVAMLTGYQLDYSSAKAQVGVAELRIENNKALFFIETVNSTATNLNLTLYRVKRVSTYQSASVVVEDIYSGETGSAEYTFPCDNQAVVE
ncbi:alpha-2-macroglobulin-like protein 1 [Pyxicephalus adspersus]|uniref:alpha-2-macroglobulin-like protein 1 n=1 Tax=Pyxicephalus adspersus TaxID=30357 RepID=UPI003B5CAB04